MYPVTYFHMKKGKMTSRKFSEMSFENVSYEKIFERCKSVFICKTFYMKKTYLRFKLFHVENNAKVRVTGTGEAKTRVTDEGDCDG